MALKTPVLNFPFPYLVLDVQIRSRKERLKAIIDTGFDGDIAIPKGLLTNGDPPQSLLPWELADGSRILAPAYLGKAKLGNLKSVFVVIITLGDEPLVGCGIIKHFAITLDHGRKVVVSI